MRSNEIENNYDDCEYGISTKPRKVKIADKLIEWSFLSESRILSNERWKTKTQHVPLDDEQFKELLLNAGSDFKEDYLGAWTDGSNKVFPIKIGEKVIGETVGDLESGNYEFRIWDKDFLLKMNQEPVESPPNSNDRSLRWCRTKNRKILPTKRKD